MKFRIVKEEPHEYSLRIGKKMITWADAKRAKLYPRLKPNKYFLKSGISFYTKKEAKSAIKKLKKVM